MQVKTDQYIFPPRADQCIPKDDTDFLASMDWLAQFKYNDSRCIIKYTEHGDVELWNRHAERFRSYTPPDYLIEELHELREILCLQPDQISMLDGGLLDQKHQAIKDTIVIWDILVKNDEQLLGTTYLHRYNTLHDIAQRRFERGHTCNWLYEHGTTPPIKFGTCFSNISQPNIFIPGNWPSNEWNEAWKIVEMVNAPFTKGKPGDTTYEIKPVLEGLVFKNPNGQLAMGYSEKNNSDWMIRSRVQTGRHRF